MASDQSEHTSTEDMLISNWSEVTTSGNSTMSAETINNKDMACQTTFDDEEVIDALFDGLDEMKQQLQKLLDKEEHRLEDHKIGSTNIDAARNHFQPDPEEHQSIVQQDMFSVLPQYFKNVFIGWKTCDIPSNMLKWIRSLKNVPMELKRRVCLPSVVIPEIATDSLLEYFKKVVCLLLFYITCLGKLVLLCICCGYAHFTVLHILDFLFYSFPKLMMTDSQVLILTLGYYALIVHLFLVLFGLISFKPRFGNLLRLENR